MEDDESKVQIQAEVQMNVNFGGFVPLSTVDWPGKSVCAIFLRGCPLGCPDCHNSRLKTGYTPMGLGDLVQKMRDSAPYISGVVISGGEPTLQYSQVALLSHEAHDLGLKVCLHTSGIYPGFLVSLIERGGLDKVALDIKDSWDNYPKYLPGTLTHACVMESISFCSIAFQLGILPEFETVFTAFDHNIGAVWDVVSYAPRSIPLVIQQGRPVNGSAPISRESLLPLCKKLALSKDPGCLRLRTTENPEEVVS